MQPQDSARFSAINDLQDLRDRSDPGSDVYEYADCAIGLALNEKRSIGPYLIRNLWRDAKITVHRRRQHERTHVHVSIDQFLEEAETDENLQLAPDSLINSESPESIYLANELCDRVLASLVADPVATASLHLAMHGENVLDISEILGISVATIKRARSRIRACATSMTSEVQHERH